MIALGLIGHPLGHSFSPRLFASLFEQDGIADGSYRLFDLTPRQLTAYDLRQLVDSQRLSGFNVTVPYKEAVVTLLDTLDEMAARIGAVNTVKVERGILKGYNTDAPAFADTLKPLLRPHHRRALILGSGGAAKAAACALRELGVEYSLVSRTPHGDNMIGYDEAYRRAGQCLLIVNATPVGMHPHDDLSPWAEPQLLTPQHLCYDLVYNPSPTRFLREAAAMGATTIGGLAMLERQATLSWKIWKTHCTE